MTLVPFMVHEALRAASECHRSGDLGEAESICRQILVADAADADALYLLGMVHYGRGELPQAARLIERAIAARPENPLYHYNLGSVYRALHLRAEAAECYWRATTLRLGFAEAHNNLGIVLDELGLPGSAVQSYERALRLAPDRVEILMNLANALVETGRPREAAPYFNRVIALDPQTMAAYAGLCDAFGGRDGLRDELARYGETLEANPRASEIWNNLGMVLEARECLAEAEDCYGLATGRNPGFVEAYHNLGLLRRRLGRDDEARQCFEKVLTIEHDSSEGHNNLGVLCYDRGLFAEAESHFRTAIELHETYATGYVNLALLLAEQGYAEAARSYYEKADRLAPQAGLKVLAACLVPVIPQSVEEIVSARRHLENRLDALLDEGTMIDDPLRQIGKANFYLAYHGQNDKPLQTKLARFYERLCPSLRFVAPHCTTRRRSKGGKSIRIGFLSRHLGSRHTVGRFVGGIMAHLDRDLFDVRTFLLPRKDGKGEPPEGGSPCVFLASETLAAARKVIGEAGLDILFYPDIGMEPFAYFLAFSRLAPVQCAFYGHPVTTGIGTVDYFISHEGCEIGQGEEHYTERLVKLPGDVAYTYYRRPARSGAGKQREDFGLSGSDHLYLCPQSLFKVHPDFDGILKGILHGDDRGVLVFFHGKHRSWADLLMKRLQKTLDGTAGRVRFLPRQPYEDYLDLIALSDVVLDTVHFNGGATTFDALAVGTPLVTLPGAFMRGRQTYGLYRRMGVMDCVARSPGAYVDLAVRLGRDDAFRERVKERIRARSHLVFEDRGMVRALEARLIAMVEALPSAP